MLRITVHDKPGSLTIQLEGRLAGPWVRELENYWQSTRASQRKPVLRFDLTGVTSIDAAGKEFLAAMHAEGAEFLTCGCLMRAVMAEITSARVSDYGCPERAGEN
jgi:anti-anti-sigma regulatory factor